MGIPLPVVPHGGALGHGLGVLHGHQYLPLLPLGRTEQHLDGVHGLADVSPARPGQVLLHPVLALHLRAQPPLHDRDAPLHRGQGILRRDLLELKHRRPGQHRPEHGEEGVLRGGGDQGDASVLHKLQQGLLLLLVEVLDLIQIEQHPLRGHQGADLPHDLLDVGNGCRGGVQPVQGAVGALGDDVGHRSLSRARGAVEDQIGHVPALDHPAQQALLSQYMLLSHHFIQTGGADLIRQGAICHKRTSPFSIPRRPRGTCVPSAGRSPRPAPGPPPPWTAPCRSRCRW